MRKPKRTVVKSHLILHQQKSQIKLKKAAFALDVNGISDVITATGTQAYSSQYYIVKLIKKTEKSSNIDDYKEKLKTVILTQNKMMHHLFKVLSEKNCKQPISRLKTKPSKISLPNISVVAIQAQVVLQKNKQKRAKRSFSYEKIFYLKGKSFFFRKNGIIAIKTRK